MPEFEVLDRETCLQLLAATGIGRVGFSIRALPAVAPVHLAVHDRSIVIPTRPGSRLAEGCRGAIVAVQVDDHDCGGNPVWAVEVVGPAQVVTGADEVHGLDRLDPYPQGAPGEHWYVVVDMGVVTGWRVREAPTAVPGALLGGLGRRSA